VDRRPLAKVKVIGSGSSGTTSRCAPRPIVLPEYQGKQTVYVIPSNEQDADRPAAQGRTSSPVTDQTRQALYRRRHGF
jgi:hypothetical protein